MERFPHPYEVVCRLPIAHDAVTHATGLRIGVTLLENHFAGGGGYFDSDAVLSFEPGGGAVLEYSLDCFVPPALRKEAKLCDWGVRLFGEADAASVKKGFLARFRKDRATFERMLGLSVLAAEWAIGQENLAEWGDSWQNPLLLRYDHEFHRYLADMPDKKRKYAEYVRVVSKRFTMRYDFYEFTDESAGVSYFIDPVWIETESGKTWPMHEYFPPVLLDRAFAYVFREYRF